MKIKEIFYQHNEINTDISKIINILENNIFLDAWNLNKCINLSKNENNIVGIMYDYSKDKKPISYIISRLCSIDLEIHRIGVLKTYRNLGIASTLIYKLVEYSYIKTNSKLKYIYLEVNENNKKAIQLYNKLGFTKYSIRPNYYNDTDDAICMKNTINNLLISKNNTSIQ